MYNFPRTLDLIQGLEWDDLYGPFQPKQFFDSMMFEMKVFRRHDLWLSEILSSINK